MQDGCTPLDCACTITCITALLDAGATLGRPKMDSRHPIHVAAASNGSAALVRRLLAMGAPVNAPDGVRRRLGGQHANFFTPHVVDFLQVVQDGHAPLDCAKSSECMTALLDGCAEPRDINPRSRTSLHVAVALESGSLVRRLLAAGAPVNAADKVRESQGRLVRLLL